MKATRKDFGQKEENMIKTPKAKELMKKIQELEEEMRKLEVIVDWLLVELAKEGGVV